MKKEQISEVMSLFAYLAGYELKSFNKNYQLLSHYGNIIRESDTLEGLFDKILAIAKENKMPVDLRESVSDAWTNYHIANNKLIKLEKERKRRFLRDNEFAARRIFLKERESFESKYDNRFYYTGYDRHCDTYEAEELDFLAYINNGYADSGIQRYIIDNWDRLKGKYDDLLHYENLDEYIKTLE